MINELLKRFSWVSNHNSSSVIIFSCDIGYDFYDYI